MKKYKILALAIFACVTLNGWAQSEDNVTGRVLDEKGKPVAGALVSVEENPLVRVATDKNGRFEITAVKGSRLKVQTGDDAMKVVKIENGSELTVVMDYSSEKVNYGFGLQQTNAESTGAVSTVYAENIDKSSAFSIGNSLYGNVLGLTTMQSTGVVWEQMPSMYIRGLKTLNGNNGILLVVDGLERDNNWQALKYITPEEVESVSVLRDAAALALYGYRGVNGVVNIVTKRGKYDTREINFSYDHAFNYMTRKPELADAYTYASALNEALTNDGKQVRYSQNELNAFKNGTSPYLYPNVNWWEEVFRDRGASDIATLSFRGGSTKMRYYTMMNLQNNRGFIKNFDTNADYSTQEKYSKANFRTNLDIDLSPKTKMQANIMGILNEFSRPGMGSDNLISKLYQLPSAAFPIRTESGLWGGNTTWGENWNPAAYDYTRSTGNPVGQIFGLQAIGYFVDQADIDNSLPQQFGPVKAGDIKYKDMNGDKVINSDDRVAMGYNSTCPEIYYSFSLGLEWKGLGFSAQFQGVGNYTAILSGTYYRPLVDNTTISNYVYRNRWTPETPNARFPRLTTETVDNNLQTSSLWLADRSFLKLRNCEVYYKLPSSWLNRFWVKNAKVYVRGVDLLCFDSIDQLDPEAMNNSYPATRSIHVGLSVGF